MELQSRTIIVTGAAGGIGSAITAACARQGARVAAVDRVEAVAPSGEGIPAEAVTPFLADLSESAGCTDLLAEVTDRLGAVDGLVNCAGVMRRGDLLEIDEDDWAATYAVNVDAVMRLCRAALPLLKKAGSAAIVNIASQWGLQPAGGHIAYNSSKAAVVSLTRSLARDFGAHGVRANSICPGEILTPHAAAEARRRRHRRIRAGRFDSARAARPARRGRGADDLPAQRPGFVHLGRGRRDRRSSAGGLNRRGLRAGMCLTITGWASLHDRSRLWNDVTEDEGEVSPS